MCPTRWVERHDSIIVMVQLLEPVFHALEEIATWKDNTTSSLADIIMSGIQKPNFLISLFSVEKVFGYTLPLCKYLQSENMDLSMAIEQVKNVQLIFDNIRINSENEFKLIYEKVKDVVVNVFKNESNITVPRIVEQQNHRGNVPADLPEQYYKRNIFIPFLDYVYSELNTRFITHRKILNSFQCLIPTGNSPTSEEKEKMRNLIDFYKEDVQAINDEVVLSEYELWCAQYYNSVTLPKTGMDALRNCNKTLYPNIYKLLKIFVTLPASTALPERTFSTLKRTKTYLRSTTGEIRLNGLAALNIHWEIKVTPEEVIDEMKKQPRRLKL